MQMPDRRLADARGPLATDELMGAISRLLASAETSLGTDLFAAKALIDQASALIGWRAEMEVDLVATETHACALAPWQVKRLTNFITINIASVMRNADLAAAAGLSTSYLLRAFKQSFGVTPREYVVQRRVQHAKHLMLSTEQPLAQIALECGLADQAHFSTYFRRVTGMTPAQWRRTHGECSEGLRNGRVAPACLCQKQMRSERNFGSAKAV